MANVFDLEVLMKLMFEVGYQINIEYVVSRRTIVLEQVFKFDVIVVYV